MRAVDVTHDVTLPVDRVYAYLTEHENLGPLFGVRMDFMPRGSGTRSTPWCGRCWSGACGKGCPRSR